MADNGSTAIDTLTKNQGEMDPKLRHRLHSPKGLIVIYVIPHGLRCCRKGRLLAAAGLDPLNHLVDEASTRRRRRLLDDDDDDDDDDNSTRRSTVESLPLEVTTTSFQASEAKEKTDRTVPQLV